MEKQYRGMPQGQIPMVQQQVCDFILKREQRARAHQARGPFQFGGVWRNAAVRPIAPRVMMVVANVFPSSGCVCEPEPRPDRGHGWCRMVSTRGSKPYSTQYPKPRWRCQRLLLIARKIQPALAE